LEKIFDFKNFVIAMSETEKNKKIQECTLFDTTSLQIYSFFSINQDKFVYLFIEYGDSAK